MFPLGGFEFERKRPTKPIPLKGLSAEAFLDRGTHGIPYVDLYIKKTATVELSILETAGGEEKLKTLGKEAAGRF